MQARLIGAVTWLSALLLAGCATAPTPPEQPAVEVDLPRFMGAWHVIANIPYWLENGKVATRDEYRLRPDGRIDNDFVFRRGFDRPERRWKGIATVQPGSGGSRWQVQFVWPLKADLQVLEVAPDYQWALLASPDRRMAWVFARDNVMAPSLYADLLMRIERHGVERCAIVRVPQQPSDLEAGDLRAPGCPDAG